MYLFVWADRRTRQFADNLSVLDYLAVTQGILSVFRCEPETGVFSSLVNDNGRFCWVPVPEGRTAVTADAKLHY